MGMTNALVRLAAGLLCSIALAPAAAAPDDAARIRAGTELWVKSFNAGNAGAVVALYSNDAVLMPPGAPMARGVVAIREAIAREIAAAKKAGISFAIGTVDEVGVSGDMAWHAGSYHVRDKAGKTVDAGKFLEAWQKKDGKWRIVRDMWNSDGAPAAPAAGPAPAPAAAPKK